MHAEGAVVNKTEPQQHELVHFKWDTFEKVCFDLCYIIAHISTTTNPIQMQ